MSSPNSAREALIAETVGELLGAVELVRRLTSELDAGAQALDAASQRLDAGTHRLEAQVDALARAAQVEVMRRVASNTKQVFRDAQAALIDAMDISARKIFDRELGTAAQRLAKQRGVLAHGGVQGVLGWAVVTAALVMGCALGLALT